MAMADCTYGLDTFFNKQLARIARKFRQSDTRLHADQVARSGPVLAQCQYSIIGNRCMGAMGPCRKNLSQLDREPSS